MAAVTLGNREENDRRRCKDRAIRLAARHAAVAHLGGDIWEVRIRLETRIARILFALEGNFMVLLHGFIKKQQKTPKPDLDLAKERLKQLRRRA